MTPEKIKMVIDTYRADLLMHGVVAKRMNLQDSFGSLSAQHILAHALHLCDTTEEHLGSAESWGKANRHFGSLQTLLSVAGWYTLEQLMEHNRS